MTRHNIIDINSQLFFYSIYWINVMIIDNFSRLLFSEDTILYCNMYILNLFLGFIKIGFRVIFIVSRYFLYPFLQTISFKLAWGLSSPLRCGWAIAMRPPRSGTRQYWSSVERLMLIFLGIQLPLTIAKDFWYDNREDRRFPWTCSAANQF